MQAIQMSYLQALAPELVVGCFGVLCLVAGMFRNQGWAGLAKPLALVGLLAGFTVTLAQHGATGRAGEMLVGPFAWYVRLTLCAVGSIIVLSAWTLPAPGRLPEMFSLMLFSIVGGMLVASANDLILLFFALELVSVPTYAMVAAGSDTPVSQEAGLKYFFLGAFSSAIIVYGFSFLYGQGQGTTLFAVTSEAPGIATVIRMQMAESPTAWLGIVLALLGLAYKVAAVPMHFYVADVYQGAAAPVSGMLSFVPKFAGLLAIAKILALVGWPLHGSLFWLIWLMAAVTMTVGNALALMQDNVKRMLAYSSVAHSGYMLMGLLVGPGLQAGALQDGLAALLFYIVAYGIMNIGAFTVIAYLSENGREPQLLQDLGAMGRARPGAALALAICVFSLLGMPPTIGFFGKVLLFGSTLSMAQALAYPYGVATVGLVILALLNTAVSSGYYLRIIGASYMRPAEEGTISYARPSAPVALGLAVCAVLVIVIGLRPGRLVGIASQASQTVAHIRLQSPTEPTVQPGTVAGAMGRKSDLRR